MAEDSQEQIRKSIADTAEQETAAAIHERIEKAKEDARKDEGWFGLKGLLFQFMEWLDSMLGTNLTGWLAEMNGTPIPQENEIQNVSAELGKSVSQHLTDPAFNARPSFNSEKWANNRKEFEGTLAQFIEDDLIKQRANYPHLDDKQLHEMAQKAAESAVAPFEDLFEANGKRKVAAQPGMSLVQEVASNKLVDGLSKLNVEDKKNLAQLLHPDGKSTDLKPSDYTALSAALSPVLTELQGQKKAGQALTAKAVAQKINHALNEKSKILKVGGIVLSDKAREVLAENMTIALSGSDKLGVEITPDFKKKSETHKQDFIKDVAKKEISQQVQEKIFEKSALMAADAFNEAGLFALGVPGTRKDLELIYKSCTLFETKDKDGKKVFRCEKPRDNLSAVELQAFEAARDRVYKAVAADNRTLNEAQVKIVGDRVAEVAVNTLSDTHGKSVSEALTKAMANAIDEETKGLLDKNETAKGNTVAKINHTNRTHAYNPNPFVESVDGNILGDISAELPKAFSNTEANKPQLQQLAEVQQALKESNNSKIAAITNGANVAANGVKGGQGVVGTPSVPARNAPPPAPPPAPAAPAPAVPSR